MSRPMPIHPARRRRPPAPATLYPGLGRPRLTDGPSLDGQWLYRLLMKLGAFAALARYIGEAAMLRFLAVVSRGLKLALPLAGALALAHWLASSPVPMPPPDDVPLVALVPIEEAPPTPQKPPPTPQKPPPTPRKPPPTTQKPPRKATPPKKPPARATQRPPPEPPAGDASSPIRTPAAVEPDEVVFVPLPDAAEPGDRAGGAATGPFAAVEDDGAPAFSPIGAAASGDPRGVDDGGPFARPEGDDGDGAGGADGSTPAARWVPLAALRLPGYEDQLGLLRDRIIEDGDRFARWRTLAGGRIRARMRGGRAQIEVDAALADPDRSGALLDALARAMEAL